MSGYLGLGDAWTRRAGGGDAFGQPRARASRTPATNSSGCSQAAKCPPAVGCCQPRTSNSRSATDRGVCRISPGNWLIAGGAEIGPGAGLRLTYGANDVPIDPVTQ